MPRAQIIHVSCAPPPPNPSVETDKNQITGGFSQLAFLVLLLPKKGGNEPLCIPNLPQCVFSSFWSIFDQMCWPPSWGGEAVIWMFCGKRGGGDGGLLIEGLS